ncbi:MAG: hypothetical protein ABI923_01330 [bacterium]
MKQRTVNVVAVTIFLVLCTTVVGAQQLVDETRIAQMRVTVQKLEGLAGDANIPAETREQLSELLFEKRGELHALLRQKRDALRSSLLGNMSAEESNSVNNTIQQLNQEMQQLKGNPTTVSPNEPLRPQSSGSGSDNTAPADVSATGASAETAAPTPVPVTPTTTTTQEAAAAAASAQPNVTHFAAAQDPCVGLGSGGASPDVEYQRNIKRTACRIFRARASAKAAPVQRRLDFRQDNFLAAVTIARAKLPKVAIPELTAQAEDASHAKNLSAGESSSGSTSLVAKAGVPAILGFAAENGGLTRTTNGTTVTFTGNPVGLVQAMAKKGFISSFQEQDDFTKSLRKFSFGLSFDTSRATQPGTFTGNKQQLSGFSFKYNIVDQRDPRDQGNTNKWLELTGKQAANLALSLNTLVDDIARERMLGIGAWFASANAALLSANTVDEIETALKAQLKELEKLELTMEEKAVIDQVGTDFNAVIEKRNEILDEISNGWIATFDYNNLRPVGTPSLSNFRFLAEKGAYKGSIDFTGNASVTIYNSRPAGPNAQTLRDFRLAGQLDVPIGDVTKTGKFLISLAGRYQRLLEDETILGTTAVLPKGDIAAFQAKLTIPIRGTAFKIPLSFSYANRTELIKEREIRGNFGFTFDLDSIFAKFNPFSKN